MKKFRLLAIALIAIFTLSMALMACDPASSVNPEDSSIITESAPDSSVETPDSGVENPDSSVDGGDDPVKPEPTYGLPVAELGYYIKDADVIDDGETRILLYSTNGEAVEDYNVIATRTATFVEEKGWLYGEEAIALEGEIGAWDEFIGSASIVKGVFEYGDVNYNYLMAYCATAQANDTQFEIGLAVASEIGGTWVKVGDRAIIEYNEAVYGTGCVGCYAPSLVNLNKQSAIRIYYTYADIYGHFAQFIDINASDLDALYTDAAKTDVNLISGTNHMPTNGQFSGGDAALMFPNADFAHVDGKVYTVKDYSPSAATVPNYADRIELGYIAESELYTVELGSGWQSLKLWDMFDTPESMYERLYSACIVADAYGHLANVENIEVIYNICEVAADNTDWMFTQNLVSIVYTA